LVINAIGEACILTERRADKIEDEDSRILTIDRVSGDDMCIVIGELWRNLPGDLGSADINMYISKHEKEPTRWTIGVVGEQAREAVIGLLLAMCGGDIEDPPATWHCRPNRVALRLVGMWGVHADAAKRGVENLVGPLRMFAESIAYKTRSGPALVARTGLKPIPGQGYPLGHLEVYVSTKE
jgi:hypothetical protein